MKHSIEHIVKAFCGERWPNPIRHGDYTYACTSSIVIRTPNRIEGEVEDKEHGPRLANLNIGDIDGYTVYDFDAVADLPAYAEPVEKECGECLGTGTDECPHCGQDADCEACDGEGVIRETPDVFMKTVKVGPVRISGLNAWLLKEIGATVLAKVGERRVLFFGVGFEGVVMQFQDTSGIKFVVPSETLKACNQWLGGVTQSA